MKAIAIDVSVGQIRAALVSQHSPQIEYAYVDPSREERLLTLAKTCNRIQTIANQVREAAELEWKDLEGIGIALPGRVLRNGVMTSSADLPTWQGQPVMEHIRSEFLPALGAQHIALVNRANAGALGEAVYGAARNIKHINLVYYAVNAEVEAGIVINGTVYLGARGNAGDWGHVVVDQDGPLCGGCGMQRGCLETVASGDAMVARAKELIQQGRLRTVQEAALRRGHNLETLPEADRIVEGSGFASIPLPEAKGDGLYTVWARDIMQATMEGDLDATEIVWAAGTALGKALVQAIRILDPHKIILGGVLTHTPMYFNAATDWVRKHCSYDNLDLVTIEHETLPSTNLLLGLGEAVFALSDNQSQ